MLLGDLLLRLGDLPQALLLLGDNLAGLVRARRRDASFFVEQWYTRKLVQGAWKRAMVTRIHITGRIVVDVIQLVRRRSFDPDMILLRHFSA